MKFIDRFLDQITMYRLLLYYLIGLLGVAMLLSAFGYMSYNPLGIAAAAGYLTFICWITNKIFAYVYDAPANPESSLITALILALIITPHFGGQDIIFMTAAA